MDENTLAARFLLGKLNDEEARQIEEDYFESNRLFEDLLAAENDLIDAYAMDKLSPDDRTRFESRLLLNAHQRRRVQFAETLVGYASREGEFAEDSKAVVAQTSRRAAFARLFSNKPLLSLSFSFAALMLFVGAIWLVVDRSASGNGQGNPIAEAQTPGNLFEPAPPEETKRTNEISKNTNVDSEKQPPTAPAPSKTAKPPTAPLKPEKSRSARLPVVFSLILSSGLTRAEGKNQTFNVPPGAEIVKMRLEFEPGDFASYHATLETVEGNRVWSSGKLKPKSKDKALTISVPSKILKKSDYVLTLKGVNRSGIYESVDSYAFTINR